VDGESEWVTVRLSYGSVREARQLLQFADRVEVLSPPEAREELAAAAASVTDLYQRVGEHD
jgi:predicted DNA-binding transcriptional regulator YafY